MRVWSWNVNGLRAVVKKGFGGWLDRVPADVVGIQEVRAGPDQIPEEVASRTDWHARYAEAERPGYSGVAVYSRRPPDEVATWLGVPEYDAEGRVLIARFGALTVANVYFPNGNGKERDNSRVPFKLGFYRRLYDVLEPVRAGGGRVLVVGDFNTAHREIDLARPKENQATSGFLPEEREELDRWIRTGWVDTFRAFEPGPGHYSWWSQRFGVRARNIGWRIDYALASRGAAEFLRGARIHPEVEGSDHCPVSVDLDPAVTGGR